MSTQRYINVHRNTSLDNLYHSEPFVIVIGHNGEKLQDTTGIYDHWIYAQKYTIKTIICPDNVTIDDLSKILDVSYHYNHSAICVHGKWIDIESKLENLAEFKEF